MSHDRGCSCGKEPMEYRDCFRADCAFGRGEKARAKLAQQGRKTKGDEMSITIKTSVCKQREMTLTQAEVVMLIRRAFRNEYTRRGFDGTPEHEDIGVEFTTGVELFARAFVITKEEEK